MKLVISIGLLFLLTNVTYSQQSTFYLAKELKERRSAVTGTIPFDASVKAVLEKEIYKGINVTIDTLNKNPFLTGLFESAPGASGNSFAAKAINGIGGLDVTKFANAIADIMIERAKQELTIAFFNRFKKFATNDNPEFQILFPRTTNNLANLLTYKYPQMLPALREGFFEDIKQITYHLDDVLELPKYRHLLINFPEVRISIRALRSIHDLEDGTSNAADIIRDFAEFPEWKEEGSIAFNNLGSSVQLAAIFSEGLRFEDDSRIWIPAKEVKTMIKDEIFTRIYMGLIYQRIKNKKIRIYAPGDSSAGKDLADIIGEQKDNIILFQNKISEFINLAEKVGDIYNEVKQKLTIAKVSNNDVYAYINSSVEIADYALSILKIFDENLVTDNYMSVIKKANALYQNIYTEKYVNAVNDALDILLQVYDMTTKNHQPLKRPRFGIALDIGPALERLINFIQEVKPYAFFMANVVEAADEADIRLALENAILPVGSSSIKKYSGGNVSVQTYLGAFLNLSSNKNNAEGTWSDKFGVTAPIGISWTPGFFSWQKAGSLSLFGALFDLGAIVDYKLKKEPDVTSNDPNKTVISKDYKIELGQIFSPGIYLVYGSGLDLPLSLGVGGQYGPGLSKIDTGSPVLANPSWRWNIFLAVDLPFFTLANKSKHKQ